MRERDIFIEALEKDNPSERAALLDKACRADAELRRRVERLLEEHERQEVFMLDLPPAGLNATVDLPVTERPGTVIGPYKLLQQIGEGGMGVVFMAEQSQPIQRKVALKIIKPGMDSRQVIARFEAERQALALMDHPHIAKVLDGGATEAGRPFFVMELVKGIPITKYCDEHHLTPRQRLELFLPVCQAVQHAHQKGIIHRDLKPSNVMVAEYDDRPVVKIIDFGVAKATGPNLTPHTLFTAFGQVVGTLEYMSPEQAKLNALDIDTRSDIYALGVLLYELLTGTTPLSHERLTRVAFDDMLRVIREEEPPKPSTRLRDVGKSDWKNGLPDRERATAEGPARQAGPTSSLVTIAALRTIEPARLIKFVTGELDWIVMKCLEKDRNRRYETANGLAMDLARYLADEPVSAAAPSRTYRLRKFVRRHKRPVIAASAICLAILAGTVGTTIGLIGQARQRAIAERERTAALHQKDKAELAKQQTKEQLFESKINQARSLTLSQRPGQRFRSLALIDEARALGEELGLPAEKLDELRNLAISALTLPDLVPLREWQGVPPGSMHVDFDENLAIYARTDDQGNCSIRRVDGDVQIHFIPAEANVVGETVPCLSRDGRFVIVYTKGASARIRSLQGTQPRNVATFRDVYLLDIHPNGKEVAFAHTDGSISHVELATGKLLHHLEPNGVTRELYVALHPTEPLVAVGSYFGNVVQVRDLETGRIIKSIMLPGEGGHVAWHPRGHSLLATDGVTGDIRVFDRTSWQRRFVFKRINQGARVFFDHAGNHLAIVGWTGTTSLFDFRTGQLLFEIKDAYATLNPRFSRDDRRLAGFIRGNRLGIWQIAIADEHRLLVHRPCSKDESYGLPTSDGQLCAASMSNGICFWDLGSGEELGFLPLDEPLCVLFEQVRAAGNSGAERRASAEQAQHESARDGSPKLRHQPLLIAERSGTYRWPIHRDVAVPGLLRIGPPEPLTIPPGCLCQSRDGQVLIAASRAVGHFEPWAGIWIQHAQRPDSLVHLLAGVDMQPASISPDGKSLVTVDQNRTRLELWDSRTGMLARELRGRVGLGNIRGVQFSTAGDWLAAGELIDTRTWTGIRSLPGASRFSPDGSVLVQHKDASKLRLTNVASGREFCRLEAINNTIHNLDFAPDGWRLFTVDVFQGIHVWDLVELRRRLAEQNLDWDAPAYTSAEFTGPPLRIEFDMGNFDELRPQQLATNLDRAVEAAPQLAVRWWARAKFHHKSGRFAEAGADLREAVRRAEAGHNSRLWAKMSNDFARFLVTSPIEFREANEAVAMAEQAVKLRPGEWAYLNTLGIADYRAGRYADAVTALERSLANGAGQSDALDLYFLAMCHHELDAPQQAQECLDRARSWSKRHAADLPQESRAELKRFRTEAEALLRAPRPAGST